MTKTSMSGIYDNWERLVAAVLKRDQIWQLCHDHSRTPSICSQSSDLDPFDDNEIKQEWTEQYEEGVDITLEASGDESIFVKRVRFSRRQFKGSLRALIWWFNNKDNIYKEYNRFYGLARPRKFSSTSGQADSASSNVSVPEESRELYENVKSRNSEVEGSASQIADEWIEIYEPGVCVTIRDYRDESRDIIRIRCSRRRFQVHQAEAWLHENIEKVCKNYNARPLRLGEENNFSY